MPKYLKEKRFTLLNLRKANLTGLNTRKANLTGFTLIELVVVISIIVFMTAIVFFNYRAGQDQLALQRAASKLAQDIRKAQGMAMLSKWCEVCNRVPFGYGLYLKEGDKEYLIYADNNLDQGNEKYDDDDVIVERIYLENKVYIKNVQPSQLSLNFRPPDPKTKISGIEVSEADSATITLSLETDPSKEKIIKVNKAGLIYVE